MLPSHGYLRYLYVCLTGSLLLVNIEYVMKLSSKEDISIYTDNVLKYIDPRESYKIQILSRVLDHIMDMGQNTDGAMG